MTKNIKKTAAIAAVMAYIKTEEEAVLLTKPVISPVAGPAPHESAGKVVQIKPWGMSGRQDMMHLRTMMQMKAFYGSRPR